MLHPREYGTSSFRRLENFGAETETLLQIKYLRVDEGLLDTVQEEQTRAREAGRSHRGGAGPGGNRGGKFFLYDT